MGKIYLLETNLYTKEGKHVYKLGRTDQYGLTRFNGYPKDYEIILVIACEDCKKKENELLKRFKQKYILYTHNEYFVGDKQSMIDDIFELVKQKVELTDRQLALQRERTLQITREEQEKIKFQKRLIEIENEIDVIEDEAAVNAWIEGMYDMGMTEWDNKKSHEIETETPLWLVKLKEAKKEKVERKLTEPNKTFVASIAEVDKRTKRRTNPIIEKEVLRGIEKIYFKNYTIDCRTDLYNCRDLTSNSINDIVSQLLLREGVKTQVNCWDGGAVRYLDGATLKSIGTLRDSWYSKNNIPKYK